ncbi:butyrophilin-like protein 1 isoform X2 [Acanthopagrus latus]|uniref:butyrophilin-like protein 1 isoform X2 n=1 Tax=Acanthopagrus latus TaxID=8177 RepID=UPI00187CFC9D|nr:butyrophilin-like protein 1 isoform X2 [Acanthopagrus latus]
MSAKQSYRMFGCLFVVLKFLSVCVWLLTLSGATFAHENGPVVNKVFVKQGSDVVLPCSINTKEDISGKLFDWRKNGQKEGQKEVKEVFLYDAGSHYNNGRPGQDEQFKGRVSHFQDQLENGNASVKIRNTKMADSGIYSCDFPDHEPRQTVYNELVVGTCQEPYIRTLDETKDWSLLQCEVRGASPEPTVEWQDSAGNILPAERPQVLESGGSYDVTLNITVTKTDQYRCVATQEELSHQIYAKTFVFISEKLCEYCSTKEAAGWLGGGFILGAGFAAVLALLIATKHITVNYNAGPCRQRDDY